MQEHDEIRDPSPEQQDPESGPAAPPPTRSEGEGVEEEGPDAANLDEDPAYEPDQPGLKDIKGG